MLLELSVQDLLLIEEARLELGAGLNVITGETGAGKTVLAHALDLLLGGRARAGIVRPGAADASVVVLARRVSVDGRTRAYLGGRSIAIGELRELAGELLSFYGQHEHRRLMLSTAQLEILDASCGPPQALRRIGAAAAWASVAQARAELERLAELAGARERQLDLLEFELGEIEQTDPGEGERDELVAQRDRLRNIEGLRRCAWGAQAALADEDAGGLRALLACAASLDAGAALDGRIEPLAVRARTVAIEAQDLASELGSYGEGLDAEPGRLEAIEERLSAIARLERKYGGSVTSALEHAQRCRERREQLIGAEVAMEAAQVRLDDALREQAGVHTELSRARAAAAPVLAREVRERLADLAMAEASFEVALLPCEPGRAGAEQVQFEIAPNPGVPAAPLREIASGGELSRVMLALLSAAHGGGSSTLVFDEIDAGIGGHTARAVGEQLRALAHGRQILAITHLPQVASFAARHFTIAKELSGQQTRATVTRLADEQVLGELVRMLGADAHDAGARRHAKELLRAA
jgi:DNA repair protein RecN (Recombination protein N)